MRVFNAPERPVAADLTEKLLDVKTANLNFRTPFPYFVELTR